DSEVVPIFEIPHTIGAPERRSSPDGDFKRRARRFEVTHTIAQSVALHQLKKSLRSSGHQDNALRATAAHCLRRLVAINLCGRLESCVGGEGPVSPRRQAHRRRVFITIRSATLPPNRAAPDLLQRRKRPPTRPARSNRKSTIRICSGAKWR